MMNLQEIINSIESLPTEERDYLFEFLRKKKRNLEGIIFLLVNLDFRLKSNIQSKIQNFQSTLC
jgi:hypothetical protein